MSYNTLLSFPRKRITHAIFPVFQNTMKHLTWSSHNSVIWEVASKLVKDGVHVDVYLHTAVRGANSVEDQGSTFTPRQTTRRKNSHKDFSSFPAHKLILGAASPFLRKVPRLTMWNNGGKLFWQTVYLDFSISFFWVTLRRLAIMTLNCNCNP